MNRPAGSADGTSRADFVPNLRSPTGPGSSLFWWLLAGVLIFGGTLRLAHIDHPVYHVDEQVAQAVVGGLDFPTQWDTNWGKTNVGSGFRYDQYNFSSYHYLLFFWQKFCALFSADLARQAGAMRAMNVVLGLFSLGALAVAGRRMTGDFAGLAAGAAGAVMPLWVEDAHYLRSESMLTAGMAALLWLGAAHRPQGRWRLVGAGLIAGWLIACKATMGLAGPLLVLILIETVRDREDRAKAVLTAGGLIGLGVILGIGLGVPFGVAQPQKYFAGLARLAGEYGQPMPPYTQPDMAPSFRVALAYLKGTLGWSFGLVAAFGLIALAGANRWWRTGLLIAPVVLALVVFGSHALFTERSYSPFLPIAVLFFGAGCQRIVSFVVLLAPALGRIKGGLMVLLLAVTLALPALLSWQLVSRVFSGQEQIDKDAALARMKGALSGKVVRMFNVAYHAENYRAIDAHLGNGETVLVLLVDYYDTISPTVLATVQQKYGGRILGVRESLFPELPPCMLTTIISPRLWLLYIPAKNTPSHEGGAG